MSPQKTEVVNIIVFTDEYFMTRAYEEARLAFEEDEIPVGAVVVWNHQIIAKCHNLTQSLNDVTAHAEIQAITAAANHLGHKYLNECSMYVTLEPCIMCAGALKWAQLGRLVYAASDEKEGFMRYGRPLLHMDTKLELGLMEAPCSALLKEFFRKKRSMDNLLRKG